MTPTITPEFAAGWQSAHDHATEFVLDVQGALETIAGRRNEGTWMVPYRDRGGGYEGLQAIAEAALARLDEFREAAPRAFGELR